MTANLDGVRVKLMRAKAHVEELRSTLGPLAAEATQSITEAPDESDPSILIYRVTRVPEIDPMIAAVAGDIVHNLRSALDHLAWQLVVFDGGQPCRTTAFPLLLSPPTNRDGSPRPLTIDPGINDPRIMAAVETMQPYSEAKYGHDPRTDALGIIGRLDNIDKHRLLLTVMHTLDHHEPGWWGSSEGDPTPSWTFNLDPLSTYDEVARFDFGGAAPPTHFDPNLKLSVTIVEQEANWGRGLDIVGVLDGLRRAVAREININIVSLMNETLLPWN